jgi:hypothetical protein
MHEGNFIHECSQFLGLLATIGIIVTAFALMWGILKLGDALCSIAAIGGIAIASMLIPVVFAALWTGMAIWQQLGIAAVGFGVWLLLRSARHVGRNKDR